jgi:hypothetical protein
MRASDPDLVAAAVPLAGLAPFGAGGLDWLAGRTQDDIDDARCTSPTKLRPGST